jgi:hypothetical protein
VKVIVIPIFLNKDNNMGKLNNKTKIILTSVIILTIVILILTAPFRNNKKENDSVKSPVSKQKQEISTKFKGRITNNISYNLGDTNLPTKVKAIKVEAKDALKEDEILDIAKNFGLDKVKFNKTPSNNGDVYYFVTTDRSLIVYSKTAEVSYLNTNHSLSRKNLNDKELKDLAKKFLTDNHIFGSNEVYPTFITYWSSLGDGGKQVDKNRAFLYKVNFHQLILIIN